MCSSVTGMSQLLIGSLDNGRESWISRAFTLIFCRVLLELEQRTSRFTLECHNVPTAIPDTVAVDY